MYRYLDNINSPESLKMLAPAELDILASEIREFLIDAVERNGGHLASNLGVVELTLAIHRVFDSPRDRIIFDVGHQSYVHKIVTGRKDDFGTLRTPGGLSGFTLRRESEHDPFGAGHSSTSLSAALGFAEADRLAGELRHTVCVIGDGAYTGGMIHEALNNCKEDLPMVIILNENGMSISSNKGTFASYLSKVRISSGYRRWKSGTSHILSKIPLIGKPLKSALSFVKERIKRVIYRENYFEQLGLYYIGTIDGHDIEKCERALREAKEIGKTVVVHVKTQKGRGYAPAEESPDGYHSVSGSAHEADFHSVFVKKLCELAAENEKIVAVTAAMGMGTGLEKFGESYPNRYFDVGIAEEHALTFSAGLAAAGTVPFVGIYSTFLQRGYDSILHDIALQSLPVKLIIDRAGLSVHDGATHHGIFDVAMLSHIPGIAIIAPVSYRSLCDAVELAAVADAPIAVRYPNCSEDGSFDSFTHVADGVSVNFDVNEPPRLLFITYGMIYTRVVEAERLLSEMDIDCGTAVLEVIKPLDDPMKTLISLIASAGGVVIVEEGVRRGGVGESIAAQLAERGIGTPLRIIAIDESFANPDKPCDLYEHLGLDAHSIVRTVMEASE